jgi:hypothetical protein
MMIETGVPSPTTKTWMQSTRQQTVNNFFLVPEYQRSEKRLAYGQFHMKRKFGKLLEFC